MKQIVFFLMIAFCGFYSAEVTAQVDAEVFDYANPKDYEIGGIKVSGATYSDEKALISIAGFRVGDKIRIPGGDIPRAMKSLWKLRLFTDIQIYKEKTIGDVVFLEIVVKERPRLSKHSFKGAKKTTHDDLNDAVNQYLVKGGIVTENIKVNASKSIEKYFIEKGFLDAKVSVVEQVDTAKINSVLLQFDVDRGDKVKIQEIVFEGRKSVKRRKLIKQLDETKSRKRIFSSSKFISDSYEQDKKNIVTYYNTIGFRDAQVTGDSIWRDEDGRMNLKIFIEEGERYYFRNIAWKGNSIYDTKTLSSVLGINAGEVYNQELLNTRLNYSEEGRDVSTLYMDNGYLFFSVDPVEVAIAGDSIDLEIRIYEGPQATIDNVVIKGNDRTHEHVVRRALRTRPGDKFSRSDIIRSQREIINLGYFNPEALGIETPVNPQRGTVDIVYTVEEKPSDQLELSAGWGGVGRGVIGTLGVSFNNFSVRNIFKKESWSPLPQGDGQRLSVRAQTNGRFFQSYNASFTEPWLGGKKPTSFSLAGFYTNQTNGLDKETLPIPGITTGFGRFGIGGATLSLGSRVTWPDDNFVISGSLGYQNISLKNWQRGLFRTDDGITVTDGTFNNLSVTGTITRSSINNPIFPQEGSKFSLSVQATPPYSAFKDEQVDPSVQERFRWLEYHKWRFDAEWYTTLVDKLTLKTSVKIGAIGAYNDDLGISPFERFQLGGDGLNNQQFNFFNGTDIISLRGYEVNDLEANVINGQNVATPLFDKFTVELRYPISLNPSSTIYVMAFAQGGNTWQNIKDFNPFEVKRSAGLGLRVFLPMFGVLGFDYGLGFDKNPANPDGNIFEKYGDFNIILGFEPE